MSAQVDDGPAIIRTKLQRPRLGQDLVPRPQLIRHLEQGLHHKLTLISAQAGAGKTTLLAQWLTQCSWPSAWLSLDSHDNDLMLFVSYLCAAVQKVFPDACTAALDLVQAPQAPPLRIILTTLVNELDTLLRNQRPSESNSPEATVRSATGIVIALDDYHSIVEPSIHGLLADLISYLPQGIHLALTTRTDPPLPLAALRARDEMTELRTAELYFSSEEAGELLNLTLGREVTRQTIELLNKKTEGWVVGLRLAALSARNRPSARSFAQRFEGASSHFVVDYLVNEVLSEQAPVYQDFLLRTSILDRFSARLCDAVLWPEEDAATTGSPSSRVSARTILAELGAANLFLIPLDREDFWFRYHHLFKDFLQHQLRRRYDPQDIAALHQRASRWFEEHDLIEEALNHAFSAGQLDQAARIVSRQRYRLMNGARWQQLDRYLGRFPPQFADRHPHLLMLKSWLLYHQGHFDQLPAILGRLEAILSDSTLSADEIRHLKGEISALKSLLYYFQNDVERTMTEAQFSIENTPPELWIVRILARVYLAGAYLMKGDKGRTLATIYQGAEDEIVQSNEFLSTMLITVCSLHWVIADMPGLRDRAQQSLDLSDRSRMVEIAGYAHYHLGCAYYHLNDLAAAEKHFAVVVQRPFLNYGDCYAHSAFGLSLTYQAQNRPVEAQETSEQVVAHLIETGNTTILPVAQAFQAEIALRQGRLAVAAQWAEQFRSIPPLFPLVRFYQPHFTLIKIWMAQDTSATRKQAAEALVQLKDYAEATFNTIVLLKALALLALLRAAEDDDEAAFALLEEALKLAQPGRVVRLFVDLGPQMAHLLRSLQERGQVADQLNQYLNRLLTAFPELGPDQVLFGADGKQQTAQGLVEPLTAREMEVLTLLAQRLSNKEIARELVVSPDTVKTHTISIYAKLDVHGRRQAVAKARAIGLLRPN